MKMLKMALMALLSLTTLTVAQAQEKKIQRADLPPAVEKTVAAQSQGATVKGFSEEKEDGKTYFEVEMIVKGHTRDVLIDTTGAVVEVEEQVAFESLPAAVKTALLDRAGKGKIVKIESLTKHDKLVAYEAKVQTDAKMEEIQVGPDGNKLNHEE